MNHVIESIGPWGVRTSPLVNRLQTVKPGDIVEVPEKWLNRYPTDHKYSKIGTISDGIAHICEDMGSAYLKEDGSCDISGGPFWGMPTDLLEPTGTLLASEYWNWGDNYPEAGKGVHYQIERPVFRIAAHPTDLTHRYGIDERAARMGKMMHEMPLSAVEWRLHMKDKERLGDECRWVFRKN